MRLTRSLKYIAAVMCSLMVCETSAAQDLMVCGESDGHVYYPQRGLAASRKGTGWTQDRIGGGRLTLSKQGDDVDILYADATGRVKSSRSDGAMVMEVQGGNRSATILVVYPSGIVESYLFYQTANGVAEVVWTQLKSGSETLVEKGGVFRALCRIAG